MALVRLNVNPSRTDLRWFAGLWFPLFWGMVGGLLFRRAHAPGAAYGICLAAVVWAVAGVVQPRIIRPAFVVMASATYPIGWVMSHAVLLLAFYIVLTPIGWLLRRFHDPLERKLDPGAKSYWVPWEKSERSSYFRQT